MEEQAEELQADSASDRRIAERLGHKIAKRPLPPEVGDGYHYYLDLYDGPYIGPMQEIPEYTTSLDTAIRLVDETPKSIGLELRNNIYADWWSCNLSENGQKCVAVKADSPALAVCRAWWAWMDREEA